MTADPPGALITDLNMPGISGLELARQLRPIAPLVPVLLLTEQRDVSLVVNAMRDGAFGCATKDMPDEIVLQEVRAASRIASAAPAASGRRRPRGSTSPGWNG